MADAPQWQCVMIAWGEKYGVSDINRLITAIATHTHRPARFILLSDRPRPGLDARAELRPIPDFFLQPRFVTGGCQAKLCLFAPGVLPDDLPAIYIDLDTVVTGDLSAGINLLTTRQTVRILQSVVLPLGWPGRLVSRLTGGRRYARGNSSVVIFHPAECGYIAERFRTLHAQYPDFSFRPMIADERFISWAAQAVIEPIPASFAVKFPAEFMARSPLIARIKARLPWVRARRAKLVAVTLCGMSVKPEALLRLPEGAGVKDSKNRVLIWSDAVIGRTRRDILNFYR